MRTRGLVGSIFLLVAVGRGGSAFAQDLPQGSAPQAPASKGTTDITAQKFETAAAPVDPEKVKDATSFSLRYDNTPLPGKEKLDTITAINLVYKII